MFRYDSVWPRMLIDASFSRAEISRVAVMFSLIGVGIRIERAQRSLDLQEHFLMRHAFRAEASTLHCGLDAGQDRFELRQCVLVLFPCFLNGSSQGKREAGARLPAVFFALRSSAGDHHPLVPDRVPDQVNGRNARQISALFFLLLPGVQPALIKGLNLGQLGA